MQHFYEVFDCNEVLIGGAWAYNADDAADMFLEGAYAVLEDF